MPCVKGLAYYAIIVSASTSFFPQEWKRNYKLLSFMALVFSHRCLNGTLPKGENHSGLDHLGCFIDDDEGEGLAVEWTLPRQGLSTGGEVSMYMCDCRSFFNFHRDRCKAQFTEALRN